MGPSPVVYRDAPALRARAGPTAKVSPARVVRAALDEVDRCRRPRVHGLLRGVPVAGGCCQRAQVLRGATNTLDGFWKTQACERIACDVAFEGTIGAAVGGCGA